MCIVPGGKPEKTYIPLSDIRDHRSFWKDQIAPQIQKYREGEITKKELLEGIASVCDLADFYRLFHVVDIWADGKPIDRMVLRTRSTLRRLIIEAQRYGWALLYRGFYAIPREVWEEYKEKYRDCKESFEKAKKGKGKGLRFEIFRLEKLTPMAQYVLVDMDKTTPENLKRVIKYLHSLGIYPEVWESASGEGNYHIYIRLVGSVKRWIERKGGEEIEHRKYYLPYATDYRVKLVVDGLKELFRHLDIPYDSISATRAVWMEGVPNPIKGGKASRKIWDGAHHRLDSLTEKLRPFWEKSIKEKAKKEYFAFTRRQKTRANVGSIEIYQGPHSNPVDYLKENIAPTFRMLDRGYTWEDIEHELKARWEGDKGAFERAFTGFRRFIEAVYRPLPNKPKKQAKPQEKRKHKHYWEHIHTIRKVLVEEGVTVSLNRIHKRTGISKGTLSYIFRIVSREQILNNPEEAQELLKAYQKGGNRMSEEQREKAKKRGRGKWEQYMEKFLEEALRVRKNALGDKEKREVSWRSEGLNSLGGVQIGPISIIHSESERKGVGGLQNLDGSKAEKIDGFGKKFFPNNGAELQEKVDITRKVKGLPEELVEKFLKNDWMPKDPPTPEDEKAITIKAMELIYEVEERWMREFGELPEKRDGYRRLIFGAVRLWIVYGDVKRYDLTGWGRFAFALGDVLKRLGHQVVYPIPPKNLSEEGEGEEEDYEIEF